MDSNGFEKKALPSGNLSSDAGDRLKPEKKAQRVLPGKVQAGVGRGDGQFLFEKYVSGRPLLGGSQA